MQTSPYLNTPEKPRPNNTFLLEKNVSISSSVIITSPQISNINMKDMDAQPNDRALNLTEIENSHQTSLPLNETIENKKLLSCLPKSGPKNYTSPRTHQKWRTGSKSQK